MDSWQLKQILKLYIYFVVKTTSSVKLFDKKVTIQKFQNGRNDFIAHVFVYKWVFTVFRKKEKKTHETFPMFGTFSLKMNAHWKWMRIENECAFRKRTTFWKWRQKLVLSLHGTVQWLGTRGCARRGFRWDGALKAHGKYSSPQVLSSLFLS